MRHLEAHVGPLKLLSFKKIVCLALISLESRSFTVECCVVQHFNGLKLISHWIVALS